MERVFSSPKYWYRCVLTIALSYLYFKKIISEKAELEWQIFQHKQHKKEDSFDTHTHTHTHTRTHTHSHNLEFSVNYGGAASAVHVWIWFPPSFVMLVMLCTLSTSIAFSIYVFTNFHWLLPILILNWWFMISNPMKVQSRSKYDKILPDKLPKKNFSKSYSWIPFSFEILQIIFFMLQK